MTKKRDMTLEEVINEAGYTFRSLSFHTDGRWIAKSGGSARYPKKLYSGKTPFEAVFKLLRDNTALIE